MVPVNLRKMALTEEIDYNFVTSALAAYKNPRVKMNDLLKKGDLIRVKKGLYVFGPELAREPYSKETLANLIYGPSYISLEYALSFYGMIPERVDTITSITNKRNKLFHTPVGTFSYRYISPSLYHSGVTLHRIDDYHSFLIATREKALADTVYYTDRMADKEHLKQYLFENLRIEREVCKRMNIRILKSYAGLYGNNVTLLSQFLENMQ
jgi:predicted transcriptional regulator of viral defense system